MTYEFEGKTEKDAIEKAMEELGLERDCFDVEILEAQRGGLFKKSYVKILLHTDDDVKAPKPPRREPRNESKSKPNPHEPADLDEEFEKPIVEFVSVMLERMDCKSSVYVALREKRALVLNIETDADSSAIIIGKKGRTIDALQLLSNLYTSKISKNPRRIFLDCEDYRHHHDDSLVRLALSIASKVRTNKRSYLLDPMNSYDRKIVHQTLEEAGDVETNSEGQGLYKQVRVSYTGDDR
jgi:spoIIIJ-associated protein